MRSILIATGHQAALEPVTQHQPSVLMKILNKPIIFHVIDFLSSNGIKHCDVLVNHLPDVIEDELGDGSAWGITLSYHLVRDPQYPFDVIRNLVHNWGEESILLGQGDILPLIHSNQLTNKKTTFFEFEKNQWSGWGVFDAASLATVGADVTLEQFPKQFLGQSSVIKVTPHLSSLNFKEYLQSNIHSMTHKIPGFRLPTTAREVQKGVWISRSVAIHPHVKVEPPVFIGEDCQIMSDAELGPNVVIESNCMIDEGSKLRDSILSQNSYVGQSLNLQNSLIDRNLLINLTHETSVTVQDDFILSEITPTPVALHPIRVIVRIVALILYGLLYPIDLYLKRTCELSRTNFLQIPTSNNAGLWKTFALETYKPKGNLSLNQVQKLFCKIRYLLAISKGYIYIVGVAPRTIEEVKNLPLDWKKLYLKSKIGLINLAQLDFHDHPTTNELYAAEAFYAINMGFFFDLKLIFRWFKMFLLEKLPQSKRREMD